MQKSVFDKKEKLPQIMNPAVNLILPINVKLFVTYRSFVIGVLEGFVLCSPCVHVLYLWD